MSSQWTITTPCVHCRPLPLPCPASTANWPVSNAAGLMARGRVRGRPDSLRRTSVTCMSPDLTEASVRPRRSSDWPHPGPGELPAAFQDDGAGKSTSSPTHAALRFFSMLTFHVKRNYCVTSVLQHMRLYSRWNLIVSVIAGLTAVFWVTLMLNMLMLTSPLIASSWGTTYNHFINILHVNVGLILIL